MRVFIQTFLSALLLAVLFCVSAEAQTLTHSYTFEDLPEGVVPTGTSVTNAATGTADATFYTAGAGSATYQNGLLTLNGTTTSDGAYIELPADVLGSKTAITLETWVTPNDLLRYSRVWDIGSTTDNSRFFNCFSWNGHNADSYTYFQSVRTDPGRYRLTVGQEYLLTVTAEQVAENSTVLSYYVNGMKIGSATGAIALSSVSGSENFLGKSHWTQDWYANAAYSQFNVYDGAMGPTQVKAESKMGKISSNSNYDRSDTLSKAAQTDSVIESAQGYWDFGNSSRLDLSGSGRNFTNNTNFTIATEADSALDKTLNSNGFYLHDQPSSNAWAYIDNVDLCNIGKDSFTLATRINMDSFKTGGTEHADDLIRTGGRYTSGTHYSLALVDNGRPYFYGYNPHDEYQSDPHGEYQEYFLNSINYEPGNPETEFRLEPGKWYDLAVVFEKGEDDNSEPSILTLFAFDSLTGEELASTTYELPGNTQFHNNNSGDQHFLLFEIWGNGHGSCNGYMDYAGVWDYALTRTELMSLMNTTSTVPEPSTWALLILGAAGLMYFRKRK